jgi:hypothetical protein
MASIRLLIPANVRPAINEVEAATDTATNPWRTVLRSDTK